jgi:hypothetical protein
LQRVCRSRTRGGGFARDRSTRADHAHWHRPAPAVGSPIRYRTGHDDRARREIEARATSRRSREPIAVFRSLFRHRLVAGKTALHCDGASRSRTGMTALVGEHAGDPIACMQRTAYYAALGYAPTMGDVPSSARASPRIVCAPRSDHHRRVSSEPRRSGPGAPTAPVRSSTPSIGYRSTHRRICGSRTSPTIESTRPRPIRTRGCR